MNPTTLLIALVSALGIFGCGTAVGMKWSEGRDAVEQKLVAKSVEAANKVWATSVSTLKPKFTTIQNEVQHEIRTNTVYSDCKLSPDGLRLVQQALGGGSISPSDSKLPTKAD